VLYVTGYTEEGAPDAVGERVLSKPFSPRELVRAVSDLVASVAVAPAPRH